MPKLTQEQLNQLLQAAGVEAVEIVNDPAQADDFELDTLLATIDQSRSKILRPRIEQELQETVDKKSQGKTNGILLTALIRNYGANRKELEAMTPEEMVRFCIEKHNETLSKDGQGLRDEMSKMANDHAQELEKIKESHKQDIVAQKDKYNARNIHSHYLKTISAKARIDGDDDIRAEGFGAYVTKRAHVVYDEEKDAIRLFQIDNPELPLQNEKRTQDITLDMLEDEYASKQGYRVKDNRHVNPNNIMKQQPPNSPSVPSGDLSKDPVNSMVDEAANWGA